MESREIVRDDEEDCKFVRKLIMTRFVLNAV